MKHKIRIIFSLLIIAALSSPVFGAAKAKAKYVTLDPAPLKAKPASAAKKVGTVEYASSVIVIKEEKGWCLIQLSDDQSVEGWIPSSALTDKKIKEKKNATSASADEIALAGKGFNSTIEAVYAEEFEVNFDIVDYIETLGADIDEVVEFARNGELNDGGAE